MSAVATAGAFDGFAPRPSPREATRVRTMRGVVHDAYGGPEELALREVERPSIGPGEILVRVRAAAVNQSDVHRLAGRPYTLRLGTGFGLRHPTDGRPGQDVAGIVESVGDEVVALAAGDEVFGQVARGGFSEYVGAPESAFIRKPRSLDFDEAAAVPLSGTTALQALRDVGRVGPGLSVLINGAAGGVGTFAVQIARARGAEVTAVCETAHLERIEALGATNVIDGTAEDFTRTGRRHDVLLDLVDNRSAEECRRVLRPDGTLVSCAGVPGADGAGTLAGVAAALLAGGFSRRHPRPVTMHASDEDLSALRELIDEGRLRPVIERRFPLEACAAAVRHVAGGHACGKTVLRVTAPPTKAP